MGLLVTLTNMLTPLQRPARNTLLCTAAVLCLAWTSPPAQAQSVPKVLRNLAYGSEPAQVADVYLADAARLAPILLVVHGGAWRSGDKAAAEAINQKVAHWIPKGFVVVSVNYRMLPLARPEQQAQDLGQAVAWVQQQAGQWGADVNRLFLMGHSSGGHMIALLAADQQMQARTGAQPWRASIILDGAGFDLLDVMSKPHAPFYDAAFGTLHSDWVAASPAAHLGEGVPPTLMICSTLREESCKRSTAFGSQLRARANVAKIVGVPSTHGAIDADAGGDNDETRAIDDFMQNYSAP